MKVTYLYHKCYKPQNIWEELKEVGYFQNLED